MLARSLLQILSNATAGDTAMNSQAVVKEAMRLIEKRADLNMLGGGGSTALHYAVHRRLPSLVRNLIKANANVNASASGFTPLMHSDFECAKMLLVGGASVNAHDAHGRTAMFYSLRKSPELVNLLLDAGIDVTTAEFHDLLRNVCQDTSTVLVQLLLRSRVSPNAQHLPREEAAFTPSPMQVAIKNNRVWTVELLLQHNAHLNSVRADSVYRPPLHTACKLRRSQIMDLLLKKRARVNAHDNGGRTPLHHAIMSCTSDTTAICQLLDYDASVHSQCNRGWRSLHYAIAIGARFEVVNILLSHGAKPDEDGMYQAPVSIAPPFVPIARNLFANTVSAERQREVVVYLRQRTIAGYRMCLLEFSRIAMFIPSVIVELLLEFIMSY